jgi:hypothetical protein
VVVDGNTFFAGSIGFAVGVAVAVGFKVALAVGNDVVEVVEVVDALENVTGGLFARVRACWAAACWAALSTFLRIPIQRDR